MRNLDHFIDLFIKELKQNEALRDYHRILNNKSMYSFRRAYYQQRLEYIVNNIDKSNRQILDVGCGYGTTSLLMAYLGHDVIGTTIEPYYDQIHDRLNFWKDHLDTSLVHFQYENILKTKYPVNRFNYIVAQDALHYIEPMDDALKVFNRLLTPKGKLIISEENGKNIVFNLKYFRERGCKRVVKKYNEVLDENLLVGNKNIRSLKKWQKMFQKNGLSVNMDSVQFIRIMPPSVYQRYNMEEIIKREQLIWKRSKVLRDYLFFGMNFCVSKS